MADEARKRVKVDKLKKQEIIEILVDVLNHCVRIRSDSAISTLDSLKLCKKDQLYHRGQILQGELSTLHANIDAMVLAIMSKYDCGRNEEESKKEEKMIEALRMVLEPYKKGNDGAERKES